jgi:hypothetical protein
LSSKYSELVEIPKHLSAAGRQGIPLKEIGCISDEVYSKEQDKLLRNLPK